MRFLVLGPIEAGDLELGAGRQRALLAFLLIHGGEVVSTERLIDALWDDKPPPSATKVVQGYVSQLRRVLPPATIETRGSGYVLLAPDTDAAEFKRLLDQTRDQLPAHAADTLRSALALWRGRPYADVEYEPWSQSEIARLEELRLVALEELFDARLRLGEAARVVPELEAFVADHPLRERPRALHMLALYRSSRQADALASFADARRRFVDELGIEPGPEVQDLQRRIFAQDPELGPVPRPSPLARVAPRARWLVAGGIAVVAAAVAAGFLVGGGRSGVRPNSLVLLDARSRTPVAQIGVGSRPSQVAIGAGAVWTLNSDDNTVSEIDPATRRLVATFATGSRTVGIAAGPEGLWLANGGSGTGSDQEGSMLPSSVTRVDPTTRAPLFTRALPAKFALPYYARFPGQRTIVLGAGSVWVVASDQSLLRLDAGNGAVQRRFPFGADSLAYGGGELWLVQQGNQVMRLDPRTNRVDLTFPLAAGPGIAYGFGSAWVADPVQNLLWRISPGAPSRSRSIPVATGSTAVAVSTDAVWTASALANEVNRVDPRTNRVVSAIGLIAPQDIDSLGSGVWVSTGAPPPASGPLPASSCSPVVYRGPGNPRFIVASDLALQGGAGTSTGPIQRGIEAVIRDHGFRAGVYTIGYQSCDDSTVQSGAFDWAKCITNARAYAADLDVIGIVGTYNSGCSYVEIPIINSARNGPLAMVSPMNTDPQLTIPALTGVPGVRMDPSGSRSFARVIAPDHIQDAADAELEDQLGVKRVAVLDDGSALAVDADRWFSYAAHRLGLKTVRIRWSTRHPAPQTVVGRVRATHADGVFVAAGGLPDGASTVAALRAGLRSKVPVVLTDWFAGFPTFFHLAGRSIDGVYVSSAGAPNAFLPAGGRRFARRAASPYAWGAPYGAAATQVLLDAIARSNGTRASVSKELFLTHFRTAIGDIAIDRNGDPETAAITVFRLAAGKHNSTRQSDFQDAVIDRIIVPPPRIIPYSGAGTAPADSR